MYIAETSTNTAIPMTLSFIFGYDCWKTAGFIVLSIIQITLMWRARILARNSNEAIPMSYGEVMIKSSVGCLC